MFIKGIEDKYPVEIIDKRNRIEGNVIACLWKQPDLYSDCKDLKLDDFITIDGQFFFRLGQILSELNYKIFDSIVLSTYLDDKPRLKEEFEKRHGYKFMSEFVPIVNTENFDSYTDELNKSNILMRLHDKGFQVIKEMPKFNNMTSDDVYQYFDFHLNNIFIKTQKSVKTYDLTSDYEEFFAECDKGMNIGVPINTYAPLTNYFLSGLHKSNMTLIGGHSGGGKTSITTLLVILATLKEGEKVCVMGNEQDIKEWRALIVSTVMSNELHIFKMNRQKLNFGKFTEEEWVYLRQAKEWLEQYRGCLEFVELFDYSSSTISKVIKKYSSLGFGVFVYDTMKTEDEGDPKQAYGEFMETSKELFQLAHKEKIMIVPTVQLSMATARERYLSGMSIARAKGVIEVCSTVLLFRGIFDDERTGERYDIKPFRFVKGDDGKYLKAKQYIEMDENKDYAILFISKNRHGKSDIQILFERNLDFNYWKEVSLCNVIQAF